MPVFRVEKNANYTVMSNYHLRDNALSLRAKGLLSQILSLPDGWDYTIAGLAAINKEGKDAVRAAVQELEQAGYIERRQQIDSGGKFSSNEYVVYESPRSVSSLSENPTTVKPTTEKPLTGNPAQLSKEGINTNTPTKPPKGGDAGAKKKKRSRDYKAQAETLPERFEKFWEFYRAHVPPERNAGNRQQAIRAWDKLAPNDELATTMAIALAKQVKSQSWSTGVGIPHASTWLNNHGWEDDWGPSADLTQGRPTVAANGEAAEWVT